MSKPNQDSYTAFLNTDFKFKRIEKNIIKPSVYYSDVLNWGLKNAFPNYLIDLYFSSAKHGSIINHKKHYICGINKSDNQFEDLYNIFSKAVLQYLIYGGFVIKRIKINNSIKLEVLPFHKVRFSIDGSRVVYGDFIFSTDFFNYKQSNIPFEEFQSFSIDNESDIVTCFVYNYNNDFDRIYPSPEYVSSLNIIEIDYKLSEFWNSFINNNLSFGYNINIYGKSQLKKEEKDRIANDFIQRFSNTSNAGKVLISFPNDKDQKLDIEVIDVPDFITKYELLNQTILEDVFIAHNITSPMLFGIRTEGQLGGRNELITAYEIFKKTYIDPIRSNILKFLKNIHKDFENLNIVDNPPIDLETQIGFRHNNKNN